MPFRIEGTDFMLFSDRDRASLAQLSFDGRVAWFEKRISLMLIGPLKLLKPRNRGGNEADLWSLLVFGTVLFNGVEALGSFCAPLSKGNRDRFGAFVTSYLGTPYDEHEDTLWDFRNSLAHGLSVELGAFEFFEGPPLRIKSGVVEMDPDALFCDFEKALDKFFTELRATSATSDLRVNFEKRFQDRYKVPPCPT